MAKWNGGQHGRMERRLKEWASVLYLRLTIAVLIGLSFPGVPWKKKECWASDREALLAFKSAVIDHGGRLNSWQGAHCCEWVGVECAKENAAANLFQLEELQHLDLSFNNFIGAQLPASIGCLQSLRYLNLSNAGFGGNIPRQLGNLTRIEYLDLSTNLSMAAKTNSWAQYIGRLSNLENLSLSNCDVAGTILPSSLLNLTRLAFLQLDNNKFFAEIPTWLGNLTNLAFPHLSDASLQGPKPYYGVPSFLSTQYRLGSINLCNNSLTGSIPAWLWELPSLEIITLKHNHFQGQFPVGLYSTSASYVDLRDNWPDGPILLPHSNASATFPAFLDLSMNRFSGVTPSTISRMIGNSTFLVLSNNKLVGAVPSSICDNALLLQVLDLSYNKLSGKIPSAFGKCISIQVLNLARNKLEGEIPKEIGNLKGLQLLHTNGNALKGSIPSSSEGCKQLHVLDLSNNNLTGIIPRNMRLLQSIAQQNDQSGAVLKFATYFTEGLFLTTMGNSMWYKYIFSMFCLIDLSSNRLSGGIPEDIGELKGLQTLNLSKNYLRGVIPEKVGDLVNLESLDFSWNNLSGRIPTSLAALTSLAYFNVSHNNLSGHIPLNTFDQSSFLGNTGLCGVQVKKKCWIPDGASANKGIASNENEDDDEEEEFDWWNIALGLGCSVGFGSVIVVLASSTRLRRRYYEIIDCIVIFLADRSKDIYLTV
eukprot:Gb_18382 [translate_table: standard]